MTRTDAAGLHEAESGGDAEIGEDGEGLDILHCMSAIVETIVREIRTYGSNGNATLSSGRVRLWCEWEDDLLLQLFACKQLHARRVLGEESLESFDCSRRGEKLAEELYSKCLCVLGSDWSGCDGCAGGRGLRLWTSLDSDGHETSDEDLSDGNHDY